MENTTDSNMKADRVKEALTYGATFESSDSGNADEGNRPPLRGALSAP